MKVRSLFFKILIALLLNASHCFAMNDKDYNSYLVNEFLNDEHYVLRYWVADTANGSAYGHISLETQNYYLSFWPEGSPNTKECLDKKSKGVFYRNVLQDASSESEKEPLFKLVKTSKENITLMNEEMKRLGAFNKNNEQAEPDGIKTIWSASAQTGIHDDTEIGSCTTTVQQVLDKSGSANNSRASILSAAGHLTAAYGYATYAVPVILSPAFPVMTCTAAVAGGVGIVGSYIYSAQTNAGGGLRFTDSKFEKRAFGCGPGHTPIPSKVFNLQYSGHDVKYDSSKDSLYAKFAREYRKKSI